MYSQNAGNFSDEILNIQYFKDQVLAYLMTATHGLERVVNDSGIITGDSVRFPQADIDTIAKKVSPGSPIVPEDMIVDKRVVNIEDYEISTKLFPRNLVATNSAGAIRQMAALKVVHGIRNRFTQSVLDALANYDDTEHEIGSSSTDFTVESFGELNLMCDNLAWGNTGKYVLLPAEARYTLEQDEKFIDATLLTNGGAIARDDRLIKSEDQDLDINWIPYRGWMVGFLPKQGKNIVGLPMDGAGTSIMGYAFKGNRIGFARNTGVTVNTWQDFNKEGNPYIFKASGACGAGILDEDGVIGIKIKPNPLS